MMSRVLLLLFLLLFGGCSTMQNRMSASEVGLEVAWQALNAADMYSTANIKGSGFEEVAPITRAVLGPEPETDETIVYFTASALAHWFISLALPPKARKVWQSITIGYSGHAVKTNCDNGLCE